MGRVRQHEPEHLVIDQAPCLDRWRWSTLLLQADPRSAGKASPTSSPASISRLTAGTCSAPPSLHASGLVYRTGYWGELFTLPDSIEWRVTDLQPSARVSSSPSAGLSLKRIPGDLREPLPLLRVRVSVTASSRTLRRISVRHSASVSMQEGDHQARCCVRRDDKPVG